MEPAQLESSPAPGLSARGARLLSDRPVPGYIDEHFGRIDGLCHPTHNPAGYVPMCIAENKLVWDLLEPKMAASRAVPQRVVEYDAMVGSESFREALAAFLEARIVGRPIDPAHVVTLAGGGTILETLLYTVADPGDGILIPTPSYAGFWPDFETRDQLEVIPVHTRSQDGFGLTPELLDAALAGADRPVRALLFTSPSNPLGCVYGPDHLDMVIEWAEAQGIHLIFDELFALSVFGATPFVSGAGRRPTLGDTIHLVWAFSKDFAASGLRCGVLVSENEQVLAAIDGLAYWAAVSGDTQYLLEQFVRDDAWLDGFIEENQRRLGAAYEATTGALERAGIPYLPGEAGFFFLCDMRPFMPEVTWEAEADLWRWLLDDVNVNLTPGADCRIGEPGFMRLVFAAEETDVIVAGVERMGRALAGKTA